MAIELGLRPGLIAALGVASVDLTFAAMAVLTGSAVLAFLSPYEDVLRIVGGTTLIALGVFGILKLRKKDADTQPELSEGRIYIQFFVLTSLNPFTIVYFMALITGNGSD